MATTKPAKAAPPTAEPSFTIETFCAAERISANTYFKLRRQGLGPREVRLGSLVRITHASRLAWQRARENPRGAEAVAVRKKVEAMRVKAERAGAKAVASPRHYSKRGGRS